MDVDILSLFPEFFDSALRTSILGRAQKAGIVRIRCLNIRDFVEGPEGRVDDRPYGGGPGMVLKPEPIWNAVQSVRTPKTHVVYVSPQGKVLDAQKCRELAQKEHLVLLCGHYEGVDERIVRTVVDEEISIGDFVLTHGGTAALVVLDATLRYVPHVLGHEDSALQDSFHKPLLDWPQYTRPEEFRGMKVPEVLLQGDHGATATWRVQQAWKKTQQVRPDLYVQGCFATQVQEEVPPSNCRMEWTLPVGNLKKSEAFFRKCLGFKILDRCDTRVVAQGAGVHIVLVQKELGAAFQGQILRLVWESEVAWQVALRKVRQALQKEIQVIVKGSEHFFTFSDDDGYCWVLAYSVGE